MAEIEDHQLVAEYIYCLDQADYFTKRAKELRNILEGVAGEDEALTLDGKPVFTYAYINNYQGDRFKKENPELAAQFTVTVPQEVLDWGRMKRMMPDLVKQYQSRSFKKVS